MSLFDKAKAFCGLLAILYVASGELSRQFALAFLNHPLDRVMFWVGFLAIAFVGKNILSYLVSTLVENGINVFQVVDLAANEAVIFVIYCLFGAACIIPTCLGYLSAGNIAGALVFGGGYLLLPVFYNTFS